jgi:AraC-like DNA-binding protein
MGRVHSVSTAGIPIPDRLTFWTTGANCVTSIGRIRASSLGNVFEAEAATRRFGSLLVFGLTAAPHRVTQYARGQEAVLKLRYQRSGEALIEQAGREVVLRAGEMAVIDGSRPHCMVNTVESRQISLHLPHGILSERDIKMAHSVATAVPMSGRVGKLLFDCLCYTLEDLKETNEPTEQDLGASIFDMFRAAIHEVASEQVCVSSRDTVEQRVREYVRRNLSNPDLSVETIASAMGCSGRYIHKIFEGQESITRMIWSQRLDRCRLELMSERGQRLTLTELAYEFGFSSSAHFSRAFKERFGITPSAFRQQVVSQPNRISVN